MKPGFPGIALLVLAPVVGAQGVSAVITPNPATAGAAISITVQDATGNGFFHHPGCIATTFHAGAPNGPIIAGALNICSTAFTAVAPFGSVTKNSTVPAAASGLVYWKTTRYTSASNTSAVVEWFCFHVQPQSEPRLIPTSTARIGQSFTMDLSYPAGAVQPYICAAALTTNVGINAGGGLFISLDPDFLFNLSFPNADPLLFSNFLGFLDASGFATGIAVNIPYLSAITYIPLHVQAGVVPVGLPVKLTTVVNTFIGP